MKFSLKDAHEFKWEGLKGWAYNSKEDFANASGAYFELTGSHGKVRTDKSDRVYFVVGGEGEFTIGGKVFSVGEKDVVIVPKNTPYDYRARGGVLKLFLVHTPAFDPDFEIKLDS